MRQISGGWIGGVVTSGDEYRRPPFSPIYLPDEPLIIYAESRAAVNAAASL
jgi:hypothetical protein